MAPDNIFYGLKVADFSSFVAFLVLERRGGV